MPKMKTHSGAKKRFRVTGSGKVMREQRQPPPPARGASPPRAPAGWRSDVERSPADVKKIKSLLGI